MTLIDESLQTHCDLLSESLFDERSFLPFFNEVEQKDFKLRVVRNALIDQNLDAIAGLGSSKFGFVTTELRRECWEKLLVQQLRTDEEEDGLSKESEKEHVDENQVQLDVRRSFTGVTDAQRKASLRELLQRTILKVLRKHPALRYYQGYHDVVSVFVIVFMEGRECPGAVEDSLSLSDMTSKGEENYSGSDEGSTHSSSASTECFDGELGGKTFVSEEKLFRCVEAFTLLYLRDFMMDSLDFPIDLLNVVPQIIKSRDRQLYRRLHLDKIEPFFAISSILTIFSHELKPSENQSNASIFQIFDLVISSQSMLIPLSMYSALILENKPNILREISSNADNFENTVDLVHGVMQQVLTSASFDEEAWDSVLSSVRSTIHENFAVNYKKVVNRYSVILTTASQPKSQTRYDIDFVLDLLDKEMDENSKRKTVSREKKMHPLTSKPLVRLFLYAHKHTIPFIFRVSLLIGLMALLSRTYRHGHIAALIPTAKMFIRNFRGYNIAGLYHGTKTVWLDPIHELLSGSMLTRASPSSAAGK